MEINNKELKQILKEQNDDFKRHVDTLAEDFHSQVKLISEQYGSIKDTLDAHTADIATIKETLDSHTEMIGSMKEDIGIMKFDMEFIKNSLKRKVDFEEFAVLEKRVATLESKVRTR